MTLYIAHNAALSTTTSVGAGTSIASGSKVTLQLNVPDNMTISLVEFGWMADVASATSSLVEIATTDTGSTMTTGHTTTTIKPYLNNLNSASRLTMGTTATGYGANSITSNTTLRTLLKGYLPQQFVYQWPLGNYPTVGNGTAESFVQLRCNTTSTINVLAYLIFDEA